MPVESLRHRSGLSWKAAAISFPPAPLYYLPSHPSVALVALLHLSCGLSGEPSAAAVRERWAAVAASLSLETASSLSGVQPPPSASPDLRASWCALAVQPPSRSQPSRLALRSPLTHPPTPFSFCAFRSLIYFFSFPREARAFPPPSFCTALRAPSLSFALLAPSMCFSDGGLLTPPTHFPIPFSSPSLQARPAAVACRLLSEKCFAPFASLVESSRVLSPPLAMCVCSSFLTP